MSKIKEEFEIIRPLTYLNNALKEAKAIYTAKNSDFNSAYIIIYDALLKIKEFRKQQQLYMHWWNNTYHKPNTVEQLSNIEKLSDAEQIKEYLEQIKKYLEDAVEVKNFYNNTLEILNSFIKQLILIQFDENNTGPSSPTILQLEKILTVPYSDSNSILSFFEEHDYTNDEKINRKVIVVGDIYMFKVWESIGEGKYNENFVKYLNRYMGLLRNYETNEKKGEINKRLSNSIYTPRNGFTNEEVLKIIDTYKKL